MLQADPAGLRAAAADLSAAAMGLGGLGVPAHPPLGADETSTTAAARLSGHGAVLASRAADGASVLAAAAGAIAQAADTYTAMDTANRGLVSLEGGAGPVPFAAPAAAVANLPHAGMPIAPITRPPETVAATMEAGSPDAGATYISLCARLAQGFTDAAASARAAASAVTGNLHGQAAPKIAAALDRYAAWAADMADHAQALGREAGAHRDRFTQTRQSTPGTVEFHDARTRIQNAVAAHNAHPTPDSAAAVTQAVDNYTMLNNRTHVVTAGYYTGELPDTLPAPPPIAPATTPGAAPDAPSSDAPRHDDPDADKKAADTDSDDTDDAGDPTDPAGDPGQLASTAPMMAASLPGMVAGMLGGAVGMAASIPGQLAGLASGLASQATQAVTGMTGGHDGADVPDVDADAPAPDDLGGGGAGAGVGGTDGGTAPAAGPAVSGRAPMYGMGSPPPAPATAPAGSVAPMSAVSAGGAGMMPMMMPMGAGMGAGGGSPTREVGEADKEVVVPKGPNAEPVKGERGQQRQTAVVDAGGKRDVVITTSRRA